MARLGRSFPRQAIIGPRRGAAAGTAVGDGVATGTGSAASVGAELAAGVASAAGASTASGVGQELAAGAGAAAGTGTAAGVGRSIATGVGVASGAGSAAATGVDLSIGVGAAAGSSTGAGAAAGNVAGTGAAAGTSAGAGVGQKVAQAAGAAAGSSTAAGAGVALHPADGVAAGVGSAAGVGTSITTVVGTGAAAGSSTASGAGRRAAVGVGVAQGESVAGAAGVLFQLSPPISYPFPAPPEFLPRAISMASRNTSMMQESPTTGQQLIGSTTFERWEWEVELPTMKKREGERVAAFLESLRGMRGSFEFGSPKKRRARGSARQGDNPVVIGSTSREIFVNATSILGDRKQWLAAGDMISLGPHNSITRRLYRVLRDVDLAGGRGMIDVWPALRIVPLIPGGVIFVEDPTAIFRLSNQAVEHQVDLDGWYHFPRIQIHQWIEPLSEFPDNVQITTGQAQGEGNAAGVGLVIVIGTGAAFGSSTAIGVITGAIAAAAGTSTAAGIGTKIARGTGAAAGTGSTNGVGRAGSVGAAAGVGSAAGVGVKLARGVGLAVGSGAAAGVGQSTQIKVGVGAAAGSSTAAASGSVTVPGTGNIEADGTLLTLSVDGVAWAPSSGPTTVTGTGAAAGSSTANAIALLKAWSPVNKNSRVALSGGNLVATVPNGQPVTTWFAGRSDAAITAGQKRYWELTLTAASVAVEMGAGIANSATSFADNFYIGNDTNGLAYYGDGSIAYNNASILTGLSTLAVGDVIGIALDAGNKIWVRRNGGLWMNSGTANPATNTGGSVLAGGLTGTVYPAYNHLINGGPSVWTANFAGPFAFAAPSGFTAI